ncbi:hypothetical protein ACFPIK_14185 [Algoriphagus aquatilis]|uniref:Outer membrane protein beta-barrel domain-containing protein n=1 Tax=Algoriphagus aquatilis TaxID=490186 RepID=A0ABW0BZ26_9BACT
MRKVINYCLWLIFISLSLPVAAQSNLSIEFRTGANFTNFSYQGNFPDLKIETVDNRFYGISLMKNLPSKLSFGLDLSFHRFDINTRYLPLDTESNSGGVRSNYWSLGPKMSYDVFFLPNFGLNLGTSLLVSITNNEEYTYQGGELQIVRIGNGGPRVPVKLGGTREIEESTFVLRPELSFFYQISDKSRISITSQWGLDFREPSIVIDLNRIEFDGETYQNKYFYSGNYFSTLLGYRYSF